MNTILEQLEAIAKNFPLYKLRRTEYASEELIPFRVSPNPLILTEKQHQDIKRIGVEISAYFLAVQELYEKDEDVKQLLDFHVPEILCGNRQSNFLFIRPDLVLTAEGFKLCEIETSTFGLSLADILNRSYRNIGIETMVETEKLRDYLQTNTSDRGMVIDSAKTKAFYGQLQYLAERLLSNDDTRRWSIGEIQESLNTAETTWRAFYLADFVKDKNVRQFILRQLQKNDGKNIVPGLSPQMEEKAILSFVWDKRYQDYFRQQLGVSGVNYLRQLIPPTWIVGHEKHFLDEKIESSFEISERGKADRRYVLKSSGFGDSPSWGEGVTFLHKISGIQAATKINDAVNSPQLYIMQAYKEGIKQATSYFQNGAVIPFDGRVRVTPYYSLKDGCLLTIKATIRANSELIHASTDSINTAVAIQS